MNYSAAVDFILERTDYERWPGYAYANRFDLRRMEDLLHRLGDPHLSARSVHIAGSKGKGSTAAMIAAGLRAAGHKTGLYTSPHLLTLRERISLDGKPILKRELADVVASLRPHAEEMDRDRTYGELTTFELLTVAAFLHFHQKGVDFQVLETGLGGRLDATNVVTPEVCVITSISLDHQEVLGNTIAQIAAEKAGIIKPGIPVVSSPQAKEAATVLRETCLERGARLITVGSDISWQRISSNLSGQSLEVTGMRGSYQLTLPLLGSYQLQNAATAVATLETLDVPKESIEVGLANTYWPGRLQIIRRRPMLVVDGAHSSDSARQLKEALEQHFHFDQLILIIGTSADKDISGIAAELAPMADSVIATRSRHPRATAPEAVAGEFARLGLRAEVAEDVAQAVAKAQAKAGKRDLICATGSLFLVGEVIENVKGLRPELYPQ
ncbi:MAG: bifunctional folylpolyglutamate synthase/dihydrofolate synthase [Dehalococcoidia bacterium]|nr:MAG: bifunctional folylpolyglutamate synthase/dihydrofolate synthase [Dehalococcoidia bacterium]